MTKEDNLRFEMRSHKIQQLLNSKPSAYISYGTVIIAALTFVILVILLFLPFPGGNGEKVLKHIAPFTNTESIMDIIDE